MSKVNQVVKGDKPNEFLAYTGGPLGPQLRAYEDTPSIFTVIIEALAPSLLKNRS